MSTPSEEVKNRLDIIDVIGGYVRLHQAGANFKATCPFHHEKTASFYTSREKQIWHCFGCGAGGDIFSFVMKIEGLEFPEALRLLADRAGVTIQQEDPRIRSERMRLQDLMKSAVAFYEEVFARASEAEVREYIKRRGVGDETRGRFNIGYAPHDAWDGLMRHLSFKGYRPEEIERAGLAVRGDDGRWRDRFHNRLMFPLFDGQGVAVGFSGRHFEARHPATSRMTPAKYVNTPETILYNKSRLLYGLHLAKEAIRQTKHAVLVEGQFDVVLSHQAGIMQAIATSGTALTEDHIRLIKRHTTRIRTAFDNDAAGAMATNRSVLLLLANDIAVEVIRIQSGKDPADLVLADPAAWQKIVENAEPLLDFYLRNVQERAEGADAAQKRDLLNQVLAPLAVVSDPVTKGHYVGKLADVLRVEARYVQEAMDRLLAQASGVRQAKAHDMQTARSLAVLPQNRWMDIEEYLIAFLVANKDLATKYRAELSEDLFTFAHTKTLYAALLAEESGSKNQEKISDELKLELGRMALKADRFAERLGQFDAEQEIASFIHELKTSRIRSRLRELTNVLRSAQHEVRQTILEEFQQLSAQLQKTEKHVKMPAVVR
ncbi:MAG: DNA primase [bacterium]|nr:DNA primase [bacterium]